MQPAKYDLNAKAGTTFRKVFTYEDPNGDPMDFSGYSARMQLRAAYEDPAVVLELTTENGRIEFGPDAGQLSLYIADGDTTPLAPDYIKVNYVYDLELVAPNDDVLSPLYGKFIVKPEVTR